MRCIGGKSWPAAEITSLVMPYATRNGSFGWMSTLSMWVLSIFVMPPLYNRLYILRPYFQYWLNLDSLNLKVVSNWTTLEPQIWYKWFEDWSIYLPVVCRHLRASSKICWATKRWYSPPTASSSTLRETQLTHTVTAIHGRRVMRPASISRLWTLRSPYFWTTGVSCCNYIAVVDTSQCIF